MPIFLRILAQLYPIYFLTLLFFLIMLMKRSFFIWRESFKQMSWRNCSIIFFLILAGIIFRAKYSFHIDLDPYGWRYIQDALAIKKFFFPFFESYSRISDSVHIPGYSFFAAFALFFSNNIPAVSALNIAFSALTIGIVYLITQLLTKEEIASGCAAGLLAFSTLHIGYSGEEFPMSISVFFVALEFLYFLLWLRTKNTLIGWVFIVLFFISINIKIENIIFLPLFIGIFIKKMQQNELGNQIKKYLSAFFIVGIISAMFFLPFLINLVAAQSWAFTRRPDYTAYSFFSIGNFLQHFWSFIIMDLRGFPLLIVLGYLILRIFKKNANPMSIVIGWFGTTLLYFLWYSQIFAQWNILQISIPVFILTGYLISEVTKLFLRNPIARFTLLIWILLFLALNSYFNTPKNKRYSYTKLKDDLRLVSAKDCIISFDTRTSKFSLKFIFPLKNWIFLNDPSFENQLSQCKAKLYYFNPVGYGLREETDQKTIQK